MAPLQATTSWEDLIGADRFCIQPYVGGRGGGAVFRVLREQSTASYLGLEAVGSDGYTGRLRLGRHLIDDYKRIGPPEPGTRYEGTLILKHACAITSQGLIEPTGEGCLL